MQPTIKQPNFLRKKIKILNGDESPRRAVFGSGGGGTCTILYMSYYCKYYYNNIRCNMLQIRYLLYHENMYDFVNNNRYNICFAVYLYVTLQC